MLSRRLLSSLRHELAVVRRLSAATSVNAGASAGAGGPTAVSRRAFHASAASGMGGRNDAATFVPARQKNWLAHRSKAQKKRARRKREAALAARPPPRPNANALARAKQELMRPDRPALQAQHKMVVNILKMKMEAPPSPAVRLKNENVAALERMLASGAVDVDTANFNYLIRAYGAQGQFDAAMGVVPRMLSAGCSPDVATYTALVTACAVQGNPKAAEEVVTVMTEAGQAPNEVTFGALMKAYLRADDIKGAFGVLATVDRAGLPLGPVLFTQLITALNQKGDFERAWDVFDHMRQNHCEPDEVAMSAMITACGRRDQVERAMNLLTEMKQMSMTPTHITYNSIIHAAARSFRHCDLAFDLFEEMQAGGYKRDVYSYNAVLLACSHTGDIVRARNYMRDAAINGVPLDLVSYNTLITVYARALGLMNNKAKRKALAAQLAEMDRSAGKELLEPYVPPTPGGIGTGKILVEGDEDDIADKLVRDYFSRGLPPGLSPEEEEALQADLRAPDTVKAGIDMFDRSEPITRDAGPRPGSSWVRDYVTPEALGEVDPLVSAGLLSQAEMDDMRTPPSETDEDDSDADDDGLSDDEPLPAKPTKDLTVGKAKKTDLAAVAGSGGEQQEDNVDATNFDDALAFFGESDDSDGATSDTDAAPESVAAARVVFKSTSVSALESAMFGSGMLDGASDVESDDLEDEVIDGMKLDEFFSAPVDLPVDMDEADAADKLQDVLTARFQRAAEVLEGEDLPEPDFGHDIFDLDPTDPEDLRKMFPGLASTRGIATSLPPSPARPSLFPAATAAGVVSPAELPAVSGATPPPGMVRRKRYKRPEGEVEEAEVGAEGTTTASTAAAAAAAAAVGSSSGGPRSSSPATASTSTSTSPSPSTTALHPTSAPPSPASSTSSRLPEPLVPSGFVPPGTDPDTAQAMIRQAGESVTGRRKRAIMGDGPALLHTLWSVKKLADKGVQPANAISSPETSVRISALETLASDVFNGAFWLADPDEPAAKLTRPALIEQVEQVYRAVSDSGFTPDKYTLNAMVLAYTNANQVDKAHSFVATEFAAQGVAPSARTYRPFVNMFVNLRDTDTALQALADMKKQDIPPDKDAYGLVVHGLAREWRLTEALDVLRDMKADGVTCPEKHAVLLRKRCKELGLHSELIPRHPFAWQFTPEVMKKRKSRNKQVLITARQVLKEV